MSVVPALLGVSAAIIGGAATVATGIALPRSQLLAPSIYHGDRNRRVLSLTFDDGPSESTPYLLDLLAEHRIPATFFHCGLNVQRLPAIARRVQTEGHEIGNHTFTHLRLCPRIGYRLNLQSPEAIYQELADTQQVIQQETGFTSKLFRAPYGLRWFGLRAAQQRLDLLGVLWTVIARDWILPAPAIAQRVTRGATPGGILCLHDGRDIQHRPDITRMIAALRVAIPILQAEGYRFETVSDSALRRIR